MNTDTTYKLKISTCLLAFYLFLVPLDFLPVGGGALTRFIALLPLVGCVIYVKNIRFKIDKYFIIPMLYLLIVSMTIVYTFDISATLEHVTTIAMNIALILVLSLFDYNKREIAVIIKSIVYSGWLTLALMLFYSVQQEGRLTVVVNGSAQDPNYLCGFLIFSIIYYLHSFLCQRKKKSVVFIGIFLASVLLTGSRGGLLAILCSIIFYILTWLIGNGFKLSRIMRILILLIIIFIAFNIIMGFLPESLAQRYNFIFSINDHGAQRLDIWNSVLDNFKNSSFIHQLFGYGSGTIRNFTYSGNVAHNIWLESIIETGLIGGFILFLFYFFYFKLACKMKEYIIAACFLGYIVMGLSLSLYSYKPIWNIFFLILILKNESLQLSKKNQLDIMKSTEFHSVNETNRS